MRVVGESTLQSSLGHHQGKVANGQFSGMPRAIRTRLMNPRKKSAAAKPPAALPAASEADQPTATNSAGRMALGPWLGAYMPLVPGSGAAAVEEPLSPTMYIHYRGRVFGDLEGSPVASGVEADAEAHHHGGAMAASALPVSPRQRRDHNKELAMMGSKGIGKRHNAMDRGSLKFGAGLRHTRVLNQPRSGF